MENTGVAREVDEENIILRKHEKSCFVTGEVSESNMEFLDGRMFLSKEEASELLDLLEKSGLAHA